MVGFLNVFKGLGGQRLRHRKTGVRVLAVLDGPFGSSGPRSEQKTLVIGERVSYSLTQEGRHMEKDRNIQKAKIEQLFRDLNELIKRAEAIAYLSVVKKEKN